MAADFVVKWELGRGAFGIVYLIEKKDTKEKLALKTLDLSGRSDREGAEKEAALLRRLDNPYVVSYVTSYMRRDLLCIVTEFCEGGNLGSFLERNSPLPEDLIVCWTAQITTALEYLHKENVLHRDLKPANIYLTGDLNICVGDLGIARVLEHPDAMAAILASHPLYTSPEILQQRPYSPKADIWSLGCVVFEMVAGQRALKEHVRSGKVPSVPDTYSVPLRHLVTKMLDREPQKRPDASSLLTTSPIKEHLVSPKPPLEIMKATRTALRDDDVMVPLDALQIHRRRTQQLGENVTIRDDTEPEWMAGAETKGPTSLNILLLGKTGVGKSATGNSILGQEEAFEDGVGCSVIKVCRGIHGKRFDENVYVIDTPGVCDTDGEDTLKIIGDFISNNRCELHAISLVISAANRPTAEEMSAISRLCLLFGPAMPAYLIVVVTREEDLRRRKKTARDFLLNYIGAGADILKDCIEDDRVVGLDNLDEKWRENQVQTLLQKTKEIVARHKGALYTVSHFLENRKMLETEHEEIKKQEQELEEEKERLAKETLEAEKEEAARKARLEEQEKAVREREEEMLAFKQRHEEEQRKQQEEADCLRRDFEEKERKLAEAREAQEKQRKEEEAKWEAEFKAKQKELVEETRKKNEEIAKAMMEEIERQKIKHEEDLKSHRQREEERRKREEEERKERERRRREAEEADRRKRENDELRIQREELLALQEYLKMDVEDLRKNFEAEARRQKELRQQQEEGERLRRREEQLRREEEELERKRRADKENRR